MVICGGKDCRRAAVSRGLCAKHYQRLWVHGDAEKTLRQRGDPEVEHKCPGCGLKFVTAAALLRSRAKDGSKTYCSGPCSIKGRTTPDADRFWEKVQKTESCWLWTAGVDKDGYGIFAHSERGSVRANRLSYEWATGASPAGLLVCHSCDEPSCVRPDHLWAGTNLENQADMAAKGRHGRRPAAPGERNHRAKLTEAMVREIRTKHVEGVRTSVLSKEYGIASSNIRAIIRRTVWKGVE